MRPFAAWTQRARLLKRETFTLYLVCRHPRVPWYAKFLALIVVGYALSPIDLIPDFIPILGYLDDLILIPLGIMLVIRLIPADVVAECRARSEEMVGKVTRAGKITAGVVVAIWILAAALVIRLILRN
ncbi:MAG: YkvA family protein [Deltaproteobacteria bacterium]|nr:YkvA family protein [Deltaproteobacteria bacterium]